MLRNIDYATQTISGSRDNWAKAGNWRATPAPTTPAHAHPHHAQELQPPKNLLLAQLPQDVRERLLPHLELVQLRTGQVVFESGDVVRNVFFPVDCIASLLYMMENGASAETAMVGREGVLGAALFMGADTSLHRAVIHSPGTAYRVRGAVLKQEFERVGPLTYLLLRHTQSILTQMAQTAACNRYHSVDQQLCRWLLLALDRLPRNELFMTQESIAGMLGVRREGVTEAARKLQKAGLIDYSRGHITILNRPGLEGRTCECYGVIRTECTRLLSTLKAA